MRIGVVSDTHVPETADRLPASLSAALAGCDLIIHAGDITSQGVLDELSVLAPVVAVRGNMDPPSLGLPLSRTIVRDGRSIGVIHGHGAPDGLCRIALAAFPAGTDVIVFGHSHRPLVRRVGPTLLVNPGSCVDPRYSSAPSVAMIEIGDRVSARIVPLS